MTSWLNVVRTVVPGQSVPYYARRRKNLGPSFQIENVTDSVVEVRAITGGLRRINRASFEAVANVWDDYQANRIPRTSVPTFNSSYIFGLLNLLEQKTGS